MTDVHRQSIFNPLLLLTGLLLAGGLFAGTALAADKAPPLPRDSLYQLSLPLTDQDGQRADWRARRGKPQLVAMFYTSCQYICPLIVDSGKAIEHQLDATQKKKLGILLISMDPKTDDPAALKAVVDKRKLDTRRWTLASPPQVRWSCSTPRAASWHAPRRWAASPTPSSWWR